MGVNAAVHYLARHRTLWQRERRERDGPQDQHGTRLVHKITEVRDGRRLVRIRSSVMVRRRAGMVMVCIMRCRGMQEAGCNAERRQ